MPRAGKLQKWRDVYPGDERCIIVISYAQKHLAGGGKHCTCLWIGVIKGTGVHTCTDRCHRTLFEITFSRQAPNLFCWFCFTCVCHNTFELLTWLLQQQHNNNKHPVLQICLDKSANSTLDMPFFLFLFFGWDFFPNSMIEFILTPTPPPPLCQRVSGYSPKWRLSVAGDERDEAETQRQIKGTKTPAIVLLLRVTNRQVKATQRGWNTLASIPFSPLPFFLLSLYSLDSL